MTHSDLALLWQAIAWLWQAAWYFLFFIFFCAFAVLILHEARCILGALTERWAKRFLRKRGQL